MPQGPKTIDENEVQIILSIDKNYSCSIGNNAEINIYNVPIERVGKRDDNLGANGTNDGRQKVRFTNSMFVRINTAPYNAANWCSLHRTLVNLCTGREYS